MILAIRVLLVFHVNPVIFPIVILMLHLKLFPLDVKVSWFFQKAIKRAVHYVIQKEKNEVQSKKKAGLNSSSMRTLHMAPVIMSIISIIMEVKNLIDLKFTIWMAMNMRNA